MSECIHLMEKAVCAICSGSELSARSRSGESGFHGGITKQMVLDQITDLLGIRRFSVSNGSSLPSEVFEIAAIRVGVRLGSMPEICERIVRKSGAQYLSTFDSRGTLSGGGSTVTLEGISAMYRALQALL